MQCGRLIKLIKSWYLQVQNEALAPARMVSLMEKHVEDCAVCKGDSGLQHEIERITLIVCPPTKAPKLLKPEESGDDAEEFRMPSAAPQSDEAEEEDLEAGDEQEEDLDEDLDEDDEF